MSSNTATAPALGSRENFWGANESDDDPATGHDDSQFGTDRYDWVAGHLLRSHPDATLLCPHCRHELPEDDQRDVPLSEPMHYVEPSRVDVDADGKTKTEWWYTDHRRHRHCPECGHIGWGGVLQPFNTEALLECVSGVLDYLELPDSREQELFGRAQSRKARNWNDTKIVRQLLVEYRTGD